MPKVNQVMYTLDTICEPNIMILAHMVLEIFCSQSSILRLTTVQWGSRKMSKNSATTSPTENKKKYGSAYISHIKFQDPIKILFLTLCKCNGCKDRPTDRPKPICPLNFEEVGVIKSLADTLPVSRMWCLIRFCSSLLFFLLKLNKLNGLREVNLCLRSFRHDKF